MRRLTERRDFLIVMYYDGGIFDKSTGRALNSIELRRALSPLGVGRIRNAVHIEATA